MAQFVEAIPHLLLRVFAPALGVCLAAWLVVLFVQLFSGKRHSCRLGKPVWAGLAALAIVCTTLCGKNTNGVQGGSRSHSNEIEKIESELRQVGKILDFKGHDAELWGFGVLRRIESLSDYEEQRRMANAYLDAMEHLEPLDSRYRNTSRALYNMVLLWPTFTAVQSRADDPERPYKLMYKTLLYYRLAFQDVSKESGGHEAGKASRVQQDKKRQLKSELKGELKAWCNVALNTYLPSAQKCNLSQERHAYWKRRIESVMQKE